MSPDGFSWTQNQNSLVDSRGANNRTNPTQKFAPNNAGGACQIHNYWLLTFDIDDPLSQLTCPSEWPTLKPSLLIEYRNGLFSRLYKYKIYLMPNMFKCNNIELVILWKLKMNLHCFIHMIDRQMYTIISFQMPAP